MKIWEVFLLCMVTSLLVGPAVSAGEEYIVSPSPEASSVSSEKEYIISPYPEDFSDVEVSAFALLSTHYITQGQTINHYVSVGSGVNSLEVDLNWGDTGDSLTLTVYTPSGSKLGTYRDNYDGVNGRIHLYIDP
ncbi:MAG: hypothetical protein PHV51_09035, partial [Methanosarcinaceae archaeon]|nr:hypothetical protein [Methanosarcinaceae archaeon]